MQQTYFPTITYTHTKQDPKIFDKNNPSNTGILYWQQETLEQIADLSGPLAKSNEFQIHYWALVTRLKFSDNSVIDIAFPTAIFNYAQEVNPSHIDFELKDVNAISEALQPVHNVVTNQLLPKLQKTFVDSDHFSVEFLSVPLNTMHRHPTGVASFSGTDLRKDHEKDTGIVFPLKTGNETPSFSSIIYNNPVKLIHTEYRTATGDVTTKEGIQYQKGRCATFVKGNTLQPSMAERFLGHKATNTSYLVDKTNIADIHPLLEILNEIEYTPNTQFIKADNLTKKVYTNTFNKKTTTKTTPKKEAKKEDNSIQVTYDKETRDLVKQVANVTINSLNIIEKFSLPQLRYQLMSLEQYYYEDEENITVSDYVSYTKQRLIDAIIETQNMIIDEIDATLSSEPEKPSDIEPSIEYMRKMLVSFGAPEEDIKNAADITIKNWYTEITLYDEVY